MTLLGIAWKEWLTRKEDSYNILNEKKKKNLHTSWTPVSFTSRPKLKSKRKTLMKQPAHPYKDFRGYPVPMGISPFPSDPDIMNIGPKLKK